MSLVSLVIPARNAERTVSRCLSAVLPLLENGELCEIIVVDDSSTDRTAEIATQFSVIVVRSHGVGPGAARNTGWKLARGKLIWFVDADCVAAPDALQKLRAHLDGESCWAAGGTYSAAIEESLLANLIQHEISLRHERMPASVDYLASFNLLWRRDALERLGGFDERLQLAQDVDLAYRAKRSGATLLFDAASKVGHFHPTRLGGYLRKQTRHGFWRMALYSRFPERVSGDSYSTYLDHLQPLAALLSVIAAGVAVHSGFVPAAGLFLFTAVLTAPMCVRLTSRIGGAGLWYLPLSLIRAYARALGAVFGAATFFFRSRDPRPLKKPAWVFSKTAAKSISRLW